MSLARAKGLAESIANAPDDARIEGVREIGAEIATLVGVAEARFDALHRELRGDKSERQALLTRKAMAGAPATMWTAASWGVSFALEAAEKEAEGLREEIEKLREDNAHKQREIDYLVTGEEA